MAEDILSYEDLKHWDSSVCYDEEIRDEICAEEAYVYPYEAEQNVPVKISVTELKRLELQARQMEEDVWVDSELPEVGAAEGIRMPDLTQIEGNEESEPAQSGAEEKADLPQTGEAKKRDLPQTGENTEETNGISDIPRSTVSRGKGAAFRRHREVRCTIWCLSIFLMNCSMSTRMPPCWNAGCNHLRQRDI